MPNVSTSSCRPILVVAAVLKDPDGRILLQQRPVNRDHAGLWEFPGGKVEPRETLTDALARELAEELDIVADVHAMVPLLFATERHRDREIVLLLYEVARWTGVVRGCEGQAIEWRLPHDIDRDAMPPLDRPLLDRLRLRTG